MAEKVTVFNPTTNDEIKKLTPITEYTGEKMLNTLESIDGTLKRIEQFLNRLTKASE